MTEHIRASSARLRVLMLLENNPYPQDGRVRREAHTLVASGYAVTVICPAAARQPWHEVVDGVWVYRYPAPPGGQGLLTYLWEYGVSLLAMALLACWVWLRRGVDVIHAHNPPDVMVLIAAFFRLLGKRFVFDHHDLSPELYCARFPEGSSARVLTALVWFERLSCRLADQVIATNESYRAMAMTRGGVEAGRITVVRNGPEAGFDPLPPDPALRERAGAIIGYAGTLGAQDGVEYLLRALQVLVFELGRQDCLCVVAGDGDAAAGLKVLAADLKLETHVIFTGWLAGEALRRTLCAADVCVAPEPSNPYNDRSTLIKVAEYMALARPVVAFDLPETRFTAGAAALYARPNDVHDLARQIAALLDDPARRVAMGRAGHRRVEEVLAWRWQAVHLLSVYERLQPAGRMAHRASARGIPEDHL